MGHIGVGAPGTVQLSVTANRHIRDCGPNLIKGDQVVKMSFES